MVKDNEMEEVKTASTALLQKSKLGRPPTEVDTTRTNKSRTNSSSGTSGLSSSDSGGDGTASNPSDSGGEENGMDTKKRSSGNENKKKRPPSGVKTVSESGSGVGSSGLSSGDGSGSGSGNNSGEDEDGSNSSNSREELNLKKERSTRSKSDSFAKPKSESSECSDKKKGVGGATQNARQEEDEEMDKEQSVQFVKKFMEDLLATKPRLSPKEKKHLLLQKERKRERKRKVNRLSAQRKRTKEKELMDGLYDQFKTLSSANEALKQDSDQLKKLLQIIRELPNVSAVASTAVAPGTEAFVQPRNMPAGGLDYQQQQAPKPHHDSTRAAAAPPQQHGLQDVLTSQQQQPQYHAAFAPHGVAGKTVSFSPTIDQTQELLNMTQNLAKASNTAALAATSTLLLQQQLQLLMNPDPSIDSTPPPQPQIANRLQAFLEANNGQQASLVQQRQQQNFILEQIRDLLQAKLCPEATMQQQEHHMAAEGNLMNPQDTNHVMHQIPDTFSQAGRQAALSSPNNSIDANINHDNTNEGSSPLQEQLIALLQRSLASSEDAPIMPSSSDRASLPQHHPVDNELQQQESADATSVTNSQMISVIQQLLQQLDQQQNTSTGSSSKQD